MSVGRISLLLCLVACLYCVNTPGAEAKNVKQNEFLASAESLNHVLILSEESEKSNETDVDCKCENGKCEMKDGKKVCICEEGFGHMFKDTCKACNCGGNYSCTFDVGIFSTTKKCICPEGFHEEDGVCKECKCKNGICVPQGGKKVCGCTAGFAKTDNTTCKACECGENFNCTFDVGILGITTKKCQCPSGYSEKGGVCKACECGQNFNCTFEVGIFGIVTKKCHCPPGFDEKDGFCKACSCEHGKCVLEGNKETCVCDPEFGKISSFNCKACECGKGFNCTFDVGIFSTSKKCLCTEGFLEEKGVCKECDCGPNGTCTISRNGTKMCHCHEGYYAKDGLCLDCACGYNSTKCELVHGAKLCHCQKGYHDVEGACQDIDECVMTPGICPNNTKCFNTPGSYECVCAEGFKPLGNNSDTRTDGCEDINECLNPKTCQFPSTTCVNLPGSYKCECVIGFQPVNYLADPRYTKCRKNDSSWFVTNIVLGVLLGCVVLALIVLFFVRRRRNHNRLIEETDSTQ